MLGLGSSIISSRPKIKLLGDYKSNFSSGVDGWTAYSIDGSPTIQGAQNRPGGSSDANWLKCAFDTTQTSLCGLKKEGITTGWNRGVGDVFTVSFTCWFHNESGNDWGGTDAIYTNFRVGVYDSGDSWTAGATHSFHGRMLQDQLVTVLTTGLSAPIGDAGYNDINIYWALSGDFPLEDAEFYIKEIVVKFYGVG